MPSAIAICVAVMLGASGCDEFDSYSLTFTDVATERTKLLDDIESYQSIEEAKQRFKDWDVVENERNPPRGWRPRFNYYVVSIKGYSHLNYVGELEVRFFNNRLSEVRFSPDEFENYVAKLKDTTKLKFAIPEKTILPPEAHVPPFTKIWIYDDGHRDSRTFAVRYVGWIDTRLEKEELILLD